MASEVLGELLAYNELGAHRHRVVSERLRLRRRMLGLTQKEVVARLRRMGVATTNKSLSGLEHGAGLDVGKLPELARALECTLTYLVGLTEDPERWAPDGGSWPTAQGAATPVPAHEQAPRTPTAPFAAADRPPGTPGDLVDCPAILGPLDPPRPRR